MILKIAKCDSMLASSVVLYVPSKRRPDEFEIANIYKIMSLRLKPVLMILFNMCDTIVHVHCSFNCVKML